jgi:hypothetical protein
LAALLHEHKQGIKYVHQYCTEQIVVPGLQCRALFSEVVTHDFKNGCIVVAKEDIFSRIDERHRHNGHMGRRGLQYYTGTCQDIL